MHDWLYNRKCVTSFTISGQPPSKWPLQGPDLYDIFLYYEEWIVMTLNCRHTGLISQRCFKLWHLRLSYAIPYKPVTIDSLHSSPFSKIHLIYTIFSSFHPFLFTGHLLLLLYQLWTLLWRISFITLDCKKKIQR